MFASGICIKNLACSQAGDARCASALRKRLAVISWRHAQCPNSLPRRAVSLCYLVGELFDVLLKLFSCGPAQQVKTDHLVGALRRALASDAHDHDTSDDRKVNLDRDAIGLVTKKMAAS